MSTNSHGFGQGFSKEIDALLRVWRERTSSGTPLIAWSEMRQCLRGAGLPLGEDGALLEVAGIDLSDLELESGWPGDLAEDDLDDDYEEDEG